VPKGKEKKDDKAKDEKPPTMEVKRKSETKKPAEIIFVLGSEFVKMKPVKRGISDDSYVEIIEGVEEGQEVVSGSYKAINRELEDGRKIKKGDPSKEATKDEEK
jgi:HlyD family secretion protein